MNIDVGGMSPASPNDRTILSPLLSPVQPQSSSKSFFNNVVARNRKAPAPSPAVKRAPPAPKAIKVKIVTWNMHDSVPKGDLQELFGRVPSYSPPHNLPESLLNLPHDANHPYHLVVVAGQECPSSSGIPMGLGAGFKQLLDKDKDKDKDKSRDREHHAEKHAKHKEKEKDDHVLSRKRTEEGHESALSGWTSMVEDWLCGGGAGPRPGHVTVSDVSAPKPLVPRASTKERRKGPYQLLTKERMMGIYLAVYIHRDVKHLVHGISKSAVTAGLIGGRVGNKGGVGISIKFDGTSLLFLNAHLAAHEGKVKHRLANLAKIKAELEVDPFLRPEDPRKLSEDLTDKFDFTFIFGDLNFRLNVSRLHADWLISRKEYQTALAFDQLRALMSTGQGFGGFQEAYIDFPPTFKYDVLRTIKRRPESMKRSKTSNDARRSTEILVEDGVEVADSSSIASSMFTNQDNDAYQDPVSTVQIVASQLNRKLTLAVAAQKAKRRWRSLISPITPTGGGERMRKGLSAPPLSKPAISSASVEVIEEIPSEMSYRMPPVVAADKGLLRPPPVLESGSKSTLQSEDEEEKDKGVYDSSHKRRVPSWCDRILWKSTVIPEPEILPSGDMSRRSFWARLGFGRRASGPPIVGSIATFSGDLFAPPNVNGKTNGTASQDASADPRLSVVRSNTAIVSVHPTSQKCPSMPPTRGATLPPSTQAGNRADAEVPQTSLFSRFTNFWGSSAPTQPDDRTLSQQAFRRGDIACLSYTTLDDRGMRRLEGRSDHRPVMGVYAIFV